MFSEKFFERYLTFVFSHRLISLAMCAVVLALSVYLSSGLKLKSSLKELLPENTQSVVELDRMLKKVGGVSVLTVVVESPNVDANMSMIDDLNARLGELPKNEVRYVIAKVDAIRDFYEENALHYVNDEDLKILYSRVKRYVDYEKLKRMPMFIDLGVEEEPVSLDLDDIKERNEKNMKMPLATYKGYYGGEEGRFLILMVRPQGAAIAIDKARALIDRVKEVVAEMNPASYDSRMKVGYCGNVVTTVEEYDTLKDDMFSTFGLCIFLVCCSIVLYFLRVRIVLFLGATLLFSIALTFAVAKLAIGYLNAQTAFLASIIVGTGINYGIILVGRYLEERKGDEKPIAAMQRALANSVLPTFLAAFTTAIAFSVLLIARVKGLSQFGFIGSVGVIICWLMSMFFLPVILVASEGVKKIFKRLSTPRRRSAIYPAMNRVLFHFPYFIISVCAIIAVVSMFIVYKFIPNSIEYDFSKLRNKISAVDGTEALEKRVAKLWSGSMTPAVVLLDRPEDAKTVCDSVKLNNESRPFSERMVDNCVSVYDLLPKDQENKIAILSQFNRLLNKSWINKISGENGDLIRKMKKSLEKTMLQVEDLPDDLVRNFKDLDGNVGTFVYINPRSGMPLTDGHNLIRFADTVKDIKLPDGRVMHATGESLVFSDLVKIVKTDAPMLTFVSFAAVSLFVLLFMKRAKSGFVTIMALLWVVPIMIASMALMNIKINFFNFVALPLTFGVGVDYSINIALRFNESRRWTTSEILRNTGGAVFLCSLTTMIGYFVLTRSTNQAVAQFGIVAVIGEIVAIVAAMMIVPALIIVKRRLKKKEEPSLVVCEETE